MHGRRNTMKTERMCSCCFNLSLSYDQQKRVLIWQVYFWGLFDLKTDSMDLTDWKNLQMSVWKSIWKAFRLFFFFTSLPALHFLPCDICLNYFYYIRTLPTWSLTARQACFSFIWIRHAKQSICKRNLIETTLRQIDLVR